MARKKKTTTKKGGDGMTKDFFPRNGANARKRNRSQSEMVGWAVVLFDVDFVGLFMGPQHEIFLHLFLRWCVDMSVHPSLPPSHISYISEKWDRWTELETIASKI